jgi:hypothetical protein
MVYGVTLFALPWYIHNTTIHRLVSLQKDAKRPLPTTKREESKYGRTHLKTTFTLDSLEPWSGGAMEDGGSIPPLLPPLLPPPPLLQPPPLIPPASSDDDTEDDDSIAAFLSTVGYTPSQIGQFYIHTHSRAHASSAFRNELDALEKRATRNRFANTLESNILMTLMRKCMTRTILF